MKREWGRGTGRTRSLALAMAASLLFAAATHAAEPGSAAEAKCCRHPDLAAQYAVIWTGHQQMMPVEQLAAYAAPVLWFSPDEPLLKGPPEKGRLTGKDITIRPRSRYRCSNGCAARPRTD